MKEKVIEIGGYDEGYTACPCFWGTNPSSYVRLLESKLGSFTNLKVLDAGCGEGKNATYLANLGAHVLAIDISSAAITNGKATWPERVNLVWQEEDIRIKPLPDHTFDVVIAYGLLHCLRTPKEVDGVIGKLQLATISGGHHVICAFNSRRQDLSGHPGFFPCLLPHTHYLMHYEKWELLAYSDSDLYESHPNNGIPHHHSLTRILARKPR